MPGEGTCQKVTTRSRGGAFLLARYHVISRIHHFQDSPEKARLIQRQSCIHRSVEKNAWKAAAAEVILEQQPGEDAVEAGDEGISVELRMDAGDFGDRGLETELG